MSKNWDLNKQKQNAFTPIQTANGCLNSPSGPLGFGKSYVDSNSLEILETNWGPLRVITPLLCVKDRLAAFIHWRDRQCLEQAQWVAQNHPMDWHELEAWAKEEGMSQRQWIQFFNAVSDNKFR
ncbi:MAG: hypothetical protein VKM98_07750 [Cyanobacteriota bacterium]|nr:hypothetical protein [Cyanobacteriota bacterium]